MSNVIDTSLLGQLGVGPRRPMCRAKISVSATSCG
jgi:hypothetical protein